MIYYPQIDAEDGRNFGLDFRLQDVYSDWTGKITKNFKNKFRARASTIHKKIELNTHNGTLPHLEWQENNGLGRIVVGKYCQRAKLEDASFRYYTSHNVETPTEALTLPNIISDYLKKLQNFQEDKK